MEDLKRSVPGRKHGEDLGDVDLGDGSVNMTPKTAQATEAALTKGDASDATALPAKETPEREGELWNEEENVCESRVGGGVAIPSVEGTRTSHQPKAHDPV